MLIYREYFGRNMCVCVCHEKMSENELKLGKQTFIKVFSLNFLFIFISLLAYNISSYVCVCVCVVFTVPVCLCVFKQKALK